MKIPLVGLTPQYDYERNRIWIGPNYMDAIRAAGGIPIVLPLQIDKEELAVIADSCDGFLFTGGPDISPFRFHEETIPGCGVVIPERDKMEEDLFHIAMELGKPILGICRGIQIFNVFLGGTLYQDIPVQLGTASKIAHSQVSGITVPSHSIAVEKKSLLYSILEKEYIQVNSFHHQVIKDLSPSFEVAGTSPDSLIESIYLRDRSFVLGIKWHPEHLFRTDEDSYKIFAAFVRACT